MSYRYKFEDAGPLASTYYHKSRRAMQILGIDSPSEFVRSCVYGMIDIVLQSAEGEEARNRLVETLAAKSKEEADAELLRLVESGSLDAGIGEEVERLVDARRAELAAVDRVVVPADSGIALTNEPGVIHSTTGSDDATQA